MTNPVLGGDANSFFGLNLNAATGVFVASCSSNILENRMILVTGGKLAFGSLLLAQSNRRLINLVRYIQR